MYKEKAQAADNDHHHSELSILPLPSSHIHQPPSTMFPKSVLLLAALGQALEIRKGDQLRHGGEMSIQGEPTVFNGVLTSVSVIEGNGCPAGSYHLAPIEPGKSISTVLELDPSIYYYNNSTSAGPVSCGVSFEFDFVIPTAEADLSFGTSVQAVTKYEEGDTTRETGFVASHNLTMRVLDETLSVSKP
jgi:hypothetical protein